MKPQSHSTWRNESAIIDLKNQLLANQMTFWRSTGVPTGSGSTGWPDHSNPRSRRIASSLRTPGRIVQPCGYSIDCRLFLFELAPAPFAVYVARGSGEGERGNAPADCRVESRSPTSRQQG